MHIHTGETRDILGAVRSRLINGNKLNLLETHGVLFEELVRHFPSRKLDDK